MSTQETGGGVQVLVPFFQIVKKTRDCGNLQYTENDLFVHSALNTQETNVVGKHTGNSAMSTHSAEKEQTIAQILNWKMSVHNVCYTPIRTK